MTAITIKKGQVLHNKFGRYRHEDMIGMKYGSKVGLRGSYHSNLLAETGRCTPLPLSQATSTSSALHQNYGHYPSHIGRRSYT